MGPLSGVTVVDLTRALSGPYATLLLGALGATVIKIEEPGHGDVARGNVPYLGRDGIDRLPRHDDDLSIPFLERCRGKLGITLNLKHPEAISVFDDLVRQADVVVENFSAGTADRLGIGYEHAREINPGIVYTSISGFGGNSSDETGKAYDVTIQALSGLALASGSPEDGPVRVGLPLGDMVAPLFAVTGTLAAVLSARETGRGQHVDVSMLGALTSLVAVEPWADMPSPACNREQGTSSTVWHRSASSPRSTGT
ncbi:CoA transferase [Prescottella defluvii]|nr:CoA transferase [Prescottella defluvii]